MGKFNVGDRVEFTGIRSCPSITKGDRGAVYDISALGTPRVQWDNGYKSHGTYRDDELRIIDDQNTPKLKFKVGDRVKMTYRDADTEGAITSVIDERHYRVRPVGYDLSNAVIRGPHEIQALPKQHIYEIGDRVTSVLDGTDGTVVRFTREMDGEYDIGVQWDDDPSYTDSLSHEDVTPSTNPAPKFKAGDRVAMTSSPNRSGTVTQASMHMLEVRWDVAPSMLDTVKPDNVMLSTKPNAQEADGFKVGDRVTWRLSTTSIPKRTVGTVRGFKDGDIWVDWDSGTEGRHAPQYLTKQPDTSPIHITSNHDMRVVVFDDIVSLDSVGVDGDAPINPNQGRSRLNRKTEPLDQKQAEEIMDVYRAAYPGIVRMHKTVINRRKLVLL